MKNTVIRFDRTLINPKGNSVRYLEVSMKAPTPPRDSQPERTPLDLALVIDRSGSMSGAPLAAASGAPLMEPDRSMTRARSSGVRSGCESRGGVGAFMLTSR